MASDKTVSIKGATDKELDELILRLRKENEALYLVQDIKRKSEPRDPFQPYDTPTVSAEKPVESLYHFGVVGMKWGRRRARTPGSEDHESSRVLKNKGVKNLSTKELKELTQRLQLEKQYKDLSPNDFKRGMNIVKEITAVGTTIAAAYALTKTPLGQELIKAVSGALKKAG